MTYLVRVLGELDLKYYFRKKKLEDNAFGTDLHQSCGLMSEFKDYAGIGIKESSEVSFHRAGDQQEGIQEKGIFFFQIA